ncbi:hypothetical protein [Komagataeibacter europaeus]|uniref:hypothetical protein n=1 Tax=Komagataeibacter europaeus TaxID=33995 RepID=UPI000237DEB3|nr:hypothetical protein [Komagataeibacter europaeus]
MRSREEIIATLAEFFVALKAAPSTHEWIVKPSDVAEQFIDEAIQRGRELERTEMGRDTERLDWIGNQDVIIGEMGYTPPYWQRVFLSRYQITLPADLVDIRHTIDTAMNAENGQ